MRASKTLSAMALAWLAVSTLPATAQQIQAKDLKPGFVMNFYPIKDTSKPDQPQGRAIASLIYKEGFPFGYHKPMEMQPSLEKYRDKWWLIVFQGYLNLTESGDYTFATTLIASRGEPNLFSVCGAETRLNNVPVNKLANEQFYNTRNAYVDIPLAAGLYPIEIRYYCTKTNTNHTKPVIEFSMRGPKDPILKPFAAKDVYHISR